MSWTDNYDATSYCLLKQSKYEQMVQELAELRTENKALKASKITNKDLEEIKNDLSRLLSRSDPGNITSPTHLLEYDVMGRFAEHDTMLAKIYHLLTDKSKKKHWWG